MRCWSVFKSNTDWSRAPGFFNRNMPQMWPAACVRCVSCQNSNSVLLVCQGGSHAMQHVIQPVCIVLFQQVLIQPPRFTACDPHCLATDDQEHRDKLGGPPVVAAVLVAVIHLDSCVLAAAAAAFASCVAEEIQLHRRPAAGNQLVP